MLGMNYHGIVYSYCTNGIGINGDFQDFMTVILPG